MFRTLGSSLTESVALHVDTRYLLRKLNKKISGEDLFNSFKRAQREGNTGVEGNNFEELIHYCSRIEGMSPSSAESILAEGTGTEGVKEITKKKKILAYSATAMDGFFWYNRRLYRLDYRCPWGDLWWYGERR